VQVCPGCGEENPEKFRLCGFCGTQLSAGPRPAEVRKTVTIVFSDLKGSTSLGETLDSESLREVMSRYFDEMKRIVERHGGTVEKFIGDAVMAVFGLPRLHEDDALRAVRAAFDMKVALEKLNRELERRWGVTLTNRTGVNTGEVVAGDPVSGQRLVTGDAVNVAARLEQAAPEQEVLIGEPTYRLVWSAVEVETMEPLDLKGKSQPVPAYRLLSVRSGAMLARRPEAPLVGREEELSLLRDAFAGTIELGVCRLVTLVAQAGVGKTRLLQEFLRSADGALVLRGHCLSYGEGITFWPMTEVVREATKISEDDSPEAARAKLAPMVREDSELVAERLASMTGLGAQDFPVEEIFWAARRFLEALAVDRPVILVFEDIHWAESTFLDLIDQVRDSARAPILMICTARPDLLESRPGWSEGPAAIRVHLEALSGEQSAVVAENLLGAGLDDSTRRRIADVAEGNPLFVEQMVSMLIDAGLIRSEAEGWVPTTDLSAVEMPPTIQALLSARLDRLARDERSVLEPAAVVGRNFYRGAVEFMTDEGVRPSVDTLLGSLIRKEFVAPDEDTALGREDAFRFHHALIRDAAYQGLLKRARAELHERFVDWLTAMLGPRWSEFEEILGYHLEQAFRYRCELGPLDEHGHDLGVRASRRLSAAGRRAFARGDIPAAANLLQRAIALLPRTDLARLRLIPDLGEVLLEQGEFAEAESLLSEAILEAARAGDRRLHTEASLARLAVRFANDPEDLSREVVRHVQNAVRDAERAGDHRGMAKAYRLLGTVHGTVARYGAAEQAVLQTIEHARLAGDSLMEVRNFPPYAMTALYGPLPVTEAIARCELLLPSARRDRRTEAVLLCVMAHLHGLIGMFDEARAQYRQARERLEDLGLKVLAASTSIDSGPVEMLAGDPAAAERELRRDFERLQEMGEKYLLSSVTAYLSQAVVAQGRFEEAEELSRSCEQVVLAEDVEAQSILRRVRALALANRGEGEEALALAHEAVDIIRGTDSPVMQGDALMDLAEVLRLAGRPGEAVETLEEALVLQERKGNLVSAARIREWLRAWAGSISPAG
jgi:class 3 adenylate cyclase/tetratricopeptide (TPR) repeat protein